MITQTTLRKMRTNESEAKAKELKELKAGKSDSFLMYLQEPEYLVKSKALKYGGANYDLLQC